MNGRAASGPTVAATAPPARPSSAAGRRAATETSADASPRDRGGPAFSLRPLAPHHAQQQAAVLVLHLQKHRERCSSGSAAPGRPHGCPPSAARQSCPAPRCPAAAAQSRPGSRLASPRAAGTKISIPMRSLPGHEISRERRMEHHGRRHQHHALGHGVQPPAAPYIGCGALAAVRAGQLVFQPQALA